MTEAPPISTDLRPEGVEQRPMAWWGMVLTVMVMATSYGALAFSYVYIRVGVDRWPPEGIEPPALAVPVLSVACLAASALPMWWAGRRERGSDLAGMRLGLVGALALGGGHAGLLVADLAGAGFGAGVHSYASLYYVVPSFHLFTFALAWIFAAVLVALTFHRGAADQRHVGLRTLALYWYFLVVGGLGVLAVVYLVPHVWRQV